MGLWVNWVLVIAGIVCVIVELALGAVTGFDLALVGGSMAIGGAIGLALGSEKVGLLAAGGLALLYFAVLRNWLKAKTTVKHHASNVDAIVGKTGVVTKRIAPHEAGMVKVADELWRAELTAHDEGTREIGIEVRVESVEGVTLRVR
ncbi:MAG: NfeD family protein [Acidobacteria bacterium]|nr:NfeD family protein [Acidobacteriota bacterium]